MLITDIAISLITPCYDNTSIELLAQLSEMEKKNKIFPLKMFQITNYWFGTHFTVKFSLTEYKTILGSFQDNLKSINQNNENSWCFIKMIQVLVTNRNVNE